MSNTRKPRNGAELLAAINPQLAEQTTKLCLRPDLLDEYNDAVTALEDLRKEAGSSKGGRMASRTSPEEREAAERVRAVEEQMAQYEVEFVFRAMPKDRWRDLVDANPPREDNQVDLFSGYHRDAVLDAAVRPSLVDPEFDDDSWQQLCDLLNAGQWNRLRETASVVNNGVAEVPKSQMASDILSKVADVSKPPEPGESPPAASRVGSRRKSTTATTPTASS